MTVLYLILSMPLAYTILLCLLRMKEVNFYKSSAFILAGSLFYALIFGYQRFLHIESYFSWNLFHITYYFLKQSSIYGLWFALFGWGAIYFFYHRKHSIRDHYIDFISWFIGFYFMESFFDLILKDNTYSIDNLLLYPSMRISVILLIIISYKKLFLPDIEKPEKIKFIGLIISLPVLVSLYMTIILMLRILTIGSILATCITFFLIYLQYKTRHIEE